MHERPPPRDPVVSVIMPFFNTPPVFMQEAIESVTAQTFTRWELLLCDDGSDLDSTSTAKSYAARDPARIKHLEHEGHANRGHSATRNLGLRHALGRYVAFLDADDRWVPEKLQQQVALLDSSPRAMMLYGNTLYWYSWNPDGVAPRDFMPRLGVRPGTVAEPGELVRPFLSGTAAVPCTCSILARRRAVEQVGGFEDAFTAMYGDQAFYMKMCLNFAVLVDDTCWDLYRQHPASLCSSSSPARARENRLTFLLWLEEYLSAHAFADRHVHGTVRRELWKVRHPRWARLFRTAIRVVKRLRAGGRVDEAVWKGAR